MKFFFCKKLIKLMKRMLQSALNFVYRFWWALAWAIFCNFWQNGLDLWWESCKFRIRTKNWSDWMFQLFQLVNFEPSL